MFKSKSLELIVVKIVVSPPVIVVGVYVLPRSPVDTYIYYTGIFDEVSRFLSDGVQFLLIGDFNLPDVKLSSVCSSSDVGRATCNYVFHHNLVPAPTHQCGNVLDLVI